MAIRMSDFMKEGVFLQTLKNVQNFIKQRWDMCVLETMIKGREKIVTGRNTCHKDGGYRPG